MRRKNSKPGSPVHGISEPEDMAKINGKTVGKCISSYSLFNIFALRVSYCGVVLYRSVLSSSFNVCSTDRALNHT